MVEDDSQSEARGSVAQTNTKEEESTPARGREKPSEMTRFVFDLEVFSL